MASCKKYPIFLKLAGKLCLVIGAGTVAERKVATLLETGATVKIVAPTATATLADLAAAGRVSWLRRTWQPEDFSGALLAVAATDDDKINEDIRGEAVARGVLINVVDRPELCDFDVPAVVSRGRLQVAISTDGVSPAFARRLREQLETDFGPEYGEYLEVFGDFRRRVRATIPDTQMRDRAYDRLFGSDVLDRIREGHKIDVEKLVADYV